MDGDVFSNSGLTLNPRFVEALMGWPTGLTSCASSAMELSRFKAHMRYELWRIGLPQEDQPVQADLFG